MKAHRTDAFSLTFGLIFLGAVAIWVLNRTVHTELPGIGWFVAGTLILAGAVGILTSLRSDRASAPDTEPLDEPPAEPIEPDLDAPGSHVDTADQGR